MWRLGDQPPPFPPLTLQAPRCHSVGWASSTLELLDLPPVVEGQSQVHPTLVPAATHQKSGFR